MNIFCAIIFAVTSWAAPTLNHLYLSPEPWIVCQSFICNNRTIRIQKHFNRSRWKRDAQSCLANVFFSLP